MRRYWAVACLAVALGLGGAATGAEPAPKKGKATVVIRVPVGAEVTVQGDGMAVEAGECRFTTPNDLDPAAPGHGYDIKVTYSAGGKTYTDARKLRVYPNRTSDLDLTDLAAPDKKRRTFQYWCAVQASGDEWMTWANARTAADLAHAAKMMAAEFDALPVRGVDEDAVAVVADVCAAMTKLSKFVAENAGAGRAGEAFLRGLLGDPLGVAAEVAAEQKAVKGALEKAAAGAKKARKILTARYDLEFPEM